jgi:5-methylcytosine-specific restriction endonuclease McrA
MGKYNKKSTMEKNKKKFLKGNLRGRAAIKKILIETEGYICNICGIDSWLGNSLSLQVDHIDGNSDNNSPSNLRLLCPNCHSQTPTYKGGNKNSLKTDSRNVNLRKRYAAMNELRKLSELQETDL